MLLFVWIVLAIFIGFYVRSKGRSGVAFFLISVLLSPLIGVIIALKISPKNTKLEQKSLDDGDIKRCPHCFENVKIKANICKYCGSELIT